MNQHRIVVDCPNILRRSADAYFIQDAELRVDPAGLADLLRCRQTAMMSWAILSSKSALKGE